MGAGPLSVVAVPASLLEPRDEILQALCLGPELFRARGQLFGAYRARLCRLRDRLDGGLDLLGAARL